LWCGIYWTKFETISSRIQKKKSNKWARQGEDISGVWIRPAETDSRAEEGSGEESARVRIPFGGIGADLK